jgi:hypothetical protein
MSAMAASVAEGDLVIPATLLGSIADPLAGSLAPGVLAQPVHVGYVFHLSGTDADVLWDNGEPTLALPVDDAGVVSVLKLGASSVASTWAGKTVQLIGGSPEYQGVVLSVATIVLSPLSPASDPVDFVVVQSTGPSQIFWMALVTAIEAAVGN